MGDNETEYRELSRMELIEIIRDMDSIITTKQSEINALKKIIQQMNEDYTVVIAEMEAEIIRLKMGIV